MNWRSVAATLSSFVLLRLVRASHSLIRRRCPASCRTRPGAVLPGVDVMLVNVGTGSERRAVTNEAGLYTFPTVPVGRLPHHGLALGLQVPSPSPTSG